ncbi:VWA3B isoform 4 [Pongo abelii]|uniref:VWA3B isoform 4 n=1 Tax=Pongo abelii TaxID=9601 RepID=A0A2J8RJG8_PONAB|nr:VWA3B isoform 4 [Pongo abelii]
MEKSGSSSTISEQQLQRQEGWSNTKTDLAEQSLISSEKWLQLHGLKSNKLTLKQILSQIGFPHCEDYVASLGRPVASRYADGLFPQLCRTEDGRVYNLTAKSELIYQFVEHLTQAVESYKQRMDWLTSKSRQIFGVILEQCVTIVLDFGGILEGELDLCREALTMVLQEQVAHITKFNIIRVSQEPVKWQENATPVTKQSIATAVSWVEKLMVELTVSEAGRLDALLEAGRDKTEPESERMCFSFGERWRKPAARWPRSRGWWPSLPSPTWPPWTASQKQPLLRLHRIRKTPGTLRHGCRNTA